MFISIIPPQRIRPMSDTNVKVNSEMNSVAIIGGTGRLGFGLALRWLKAGRYVIIGSRSLERAQHSAKEARRVVKKGGRMEGLVNTEAAARADVVVLSVPHQAHRKTLRALRKYFRKGQILIDVCVPTSRTKHGLKTGPSPSLEAAKAVPSHVRAVSAFHTLSAKLVRELSSPVNCDVIICGDNSEAKRVAMDLAELLPGVRAIDGGPLSNGPIVEQLALLLLTINSIYGVRDAGMRITNIEKGYAPHSTS